MEKSGGRKRIRRKKFLNENVKMPRTTLWNRRQVKKIKGNALNDAVASTSSSAMIEERSSSSEGSTSDNSFTAVSQLTCPDMLELQNATSESSASQSESSVLMLYPSLEMDATDSESSSESDSHQSQQQHVYAANSEDSSTADSTDVKHDGSPQDDKNVYIEDPECELYENARLSKSAAISMLLAFVLRHNLTDSAINDLLEMLSIFLPNDYVLPKTLFLFRKIFSKVSEKFNIHYFCSNCGSILEGLVDNVELLKCECCDKVEPLRDARNKLSFFVHLPIADQIKGYLEHSNLIKDLGKKSGDQDEIRDITGGLLYKAISSKFEERSFLTLLFNTDGVSLYKSSNISFWPLQCVINEVSPEKRQKYMVLGGLWCGPNKPNMSLNYLKPFVKELRMIETEGITWFNKCKGKEEVLHIVPFACACDSPARALMQNFKQFNGKYGCSFCLSSGTVLEGTITRVYPYSMPVEARNHEKTLEHAKKAVKAQENAPRTRDTSEFGVKGVTELYLLPNFNIISGFSCDYMHCVLQGVTRQFVFLWCEEVGKPYYIGRKLHLVDETISNLRIPSGIGRKLTSLSSKRKLYKANQWRTLLLASPIIFHGVLPDPYYKHWMLLCHSIYMLSKESIKRRSLQVVHAMLCKFAREVVVLYDVSACTFNVHLLTHLVNSVENLGPLWASSTFSFESMNAVIKKFFHGTKGIPLQPARNFLLMQALNHLVSGCIEPDGKILDLIKKFSKGHSPVNENYQFGNAIPVGKSQTKIISLSHRYAINDKCAEANVLESSLGCYHKKLAYCGHVFLTSKCNENRKTMDSLLILQDGCVALILEVVTCSEKLFILCEILRLEQLALRDAECGTLLTYIKKSSAHNPIALKAYYPEDILGKCASLKKDGITYIIPIPNRFEST